MERAVREIKAKILIHCGGLTPFISIDRMKGLGVAMTILPSLAFTPVAREVYDAGLLVRRLGMEGYRHALEAVTGHPMMDFNEFIGFGAVRALEDTYEPSDGVGKYGGSIGYLPGATRE